MRIYNTFTGEWVEKNYSSSEVEEGKNWERTALYDLNEIRGSLESIPLDISRIKAKRRMAWVFGISSGAAAMAGVLLDAMFGESYLVWSLVAFAAVTSLPAFMTFLVSTGSGKKISDLQIRRQVLQAKEKEKKIRMMDSGDKYLLWAYHAQILKVIEDFRSNAEYYRKIHNRVQSFIIVASALVAMLATAAATAPAVSWVAAALSLLVATGTSFLGYFKFKERAMNLQRAAADLEYEYNSVELGVNEYRRQGEGDEQFTERFKDFVQRAEKIKIEQRKREQLLEQPNEVRGGSSFGNVAS